MAYLGNRAVNRLNLHYGLHAVAAICVLRFVLRPQVIPFAVRFGLGPVLIAGTRLQAAQYPLLGQISGIGFRLLAGTGPWMTATANAAGAIANCFYVPGCPSAGFRSWR